MGRTLTDDVEITRVEPSYRFEFISTTGTGEKYQHFVFTPIARETRVDRVVLAPRRGAL